MSKSYKINRILYQGLSCDFDYWTLHEIFVSFDDEHCPIKNQFLMGNSTQKYKSVISLPIKDFIHYHLWHCLKTYPWSVRGYTAYPRSGRGYTAYPGSGRGYTAYPWSGRSYAA